MSRPTLYLAITNHGFGHAVRAASIASQIQKLCPDILLIFVTTAPHWLLESYLEGDFIHRPRGFDVGVIQSDSMTMDLNVTLEKLQEIHHQQSAIIASEVTFIRQNQVDLILADIPPLAAPLAKAAGIPCWMMSNFGWDFIYRDWGGDFIKIADWIEECFHQCDHLFRLPFHEPMSAFPQIQDVGLTGGNPRYNLEELRQDFQLYTQREQTILLTFGGLHLSAIPYQNLSEFPDWKFITFDQNAPELPNLVNVNISRLSPSQIEQYPHLRPVDFMPLCGRVISKPGYSTFAEALRLEIPVVSLMREGFAEAPLLLEGIQNYAYHQIIEPAKFFHSHWEFLHHPLEEPRLSRKLDKNGSETIAQAVVNFLTSL